MIAVVILRLRKCKKYFSHWWEEQKQKYVVTVILMPWESFFNIKPDTSRPHQDILGGI